MVRTGYGGYSLLLVKTQLWLYFSHPMIFLDNAEFLDPNWLLNVTPSLLVAIHLHTVRGEVGNGLNLIAMLDILLINTFTIHSSY